MSKEVKEKNVTKNDVMKENVIAKDVQKKMKKLSWRSLPKKKIAMEILIVFLYSIALPFFCGLVFSLVQGTPLSEVFARIYRYFALGFVVFTMLITLELYIYHYKKDWLWSSNQIGIVLVSLTICFLFALVAGYYFSIYSMPLLMAGYLIALLIDKRLAIVANIMFCIVYYIIYITIAPDAILFQCVAAILSKTISTSFIIIRMKKSYKRLSFFKDAFWGGIIAAVIGLCVSLLSPDLSETDNIVKKLLVDFGLAGVWSFVSFITGYALAMVALPFLEHVFHTFSNFKLEEICGPDSELLKELAEKAPGTYNHSLSVSVLAANCAIRIGESPALAKAAAYYHDIGKIKEPLCFTENQKGYNPHDDFIPEVSVYKITNHVKYGKELIKQHKLPDIIADVAEEHHGTTPVQYFLNKAKGITDEQLVDEAFCYKGPKPHTKIAGIIMIADTVEAASRSQGVNPDPAKLREFVHRLIQSKVTSGQFTECPFTFKDLSDIEDVLVEVLPSLFHQRIKYDEAKK